MNNEWVIFSEWKAPQCVRARRAYMLHFHQVAKSSDGALIRYFRVKAHIMNVLAARAHELKSIANLEPMGVRYQIQVGFLANQWKHERVDRLLGHVAIGEVLRARHDVDIDRVKERFDPVFEPR